MNNIENLTKKELDELLSFATPVEVQTINGLVERSVKEKEDEAKRKIKEKDDEVKRKIKEKEDSGKMSLTELTSWAKASIDSKYMRYFNPISKRKVLVEIIDESLKMCTILDSEKSNDEILQEAVINHSLKQDKLLHHSQIKNIVEQWKMYGNTIDKIETYGSWNNNTSWVLGASLVSPKEMEIPYWNTFLDRLSDKEAFCAWIYGLVSKKYNGRQIVWLSGGGYDSKTFCLKIIEEFFFKNVGTIISTTMLGEGQRFGTSKVVNKILAIWDDCEMISALQSPFVKGISSGKEGSKMQIERKGKDAYDQQLEARLIILSNVKPVVQNEQSNISRLLYITISELKMEKNASVREHFIKELPGFLYYCEQCYKERCSNNQDVQQNKVSVDAINQLTVDSNQNYFDIVDKFFSFDVGEKTPTSTIQQILKKEGLSSNKEQGYFYSWLERTYKCEKKQTNKGIFLFGVKA